MKKVVCVGRQEDVAAAVARLLWADPSPATVADVLNYMRLQRSLRSPRTGRSYVVMWRGIGIDTTPRACACWIEDAALLQQWRKACAESVAL